MSVATQLRAVERGMKVIASYPEWKNTPIILGESDPEGCGACVSPQNGYRNGPLYGASVTEATMRTYELARKYGVTVQGAVTWAFEFEDQPIFAGRRSLASHGIDKPEMNFFRIAGLLGAERVETSSSFAINAKSIAAKGVRERPEIDALATRDVNGAAVLLWNYADNEVPGENESVHVTIRGIPSAVDRILMEEYRVDDRHSNSVQLWKEMGSPQAPSAEQYGKLKAAGQLELADSPRWIRTQGGTAEVEIDLPRESVDLLRLSWAEKGETEGKRGEKKSVTH
jgi:xylan 1,4-beta-xylosidase